MPPLALAADREIPLPLQHSGAEASTDRHPHGLPGRAWPRRRRGTAPPPQPPPARVRDARRRSAGEAAQVAGLIAELLNMAPMREGMVRAFWGHRMMMIDGEPARWTGCGFRCSLGGASRAWTRTRFRPCGATARPRPGRRAGLSRRRPSSRRTPHPTGVQAGRTVAADRPASAGPNYSSGRTICTWPSAAWPALCWRSGLPGRSRRAVAHSRATGAGVPPRRADRPVRRRGQATAVLAECPRLGPPAALRRRSRAIFRRRTPARSPAPPSTASAKTGSTTAARDNPANLVRQQHTFSFERSECATPSSPWPATRSARIRIAPRSSGGYNTEARRHGGALYCLAAMRF